MIIFATTFNKISPFEHQIKAYTKKHIKTLVKHKILIVSNVGTTIKHIFRTQNRYYIIEFKKADTNDNNVSN